MHSYETIPTPRHIHCPKSSIPTSSLLLGAIPAPPSTHSPSVHLSAATRDQIPFSGILYKGNPTVCVPVWLLSHPISILNLAVLWVAVVWVFILLHLFSVWHRRLYHRRKTKDLFWELVLSLYHVGLRDQSALVASLSKCQNTLEAQSMLDACMYVDTV